MQRYALISTSDRTDVVEFAQGLTRLGFKVISTGGTAAALKAGGIDVVEISQITGFPECLDGRVKTLHPIVHAGLLAIRGNDEHMATLKKLGINTIDVVAVNLYPFKKTISNPNVLFEEAVEKIDIGGPTMLRSAAKNYQDVLVAVDPNDYSEILNRLEQKTDDHEFRLRLMHKVFMHTAVYDSLIANYLAKKLGIEYPENLTLAYEKAQDLRYGENPHQSAAFYRDCFEYEGALAFSKQLHGKELSYNNINDANAAIEIIKEFSSPCAVAIKHANPCGVAVGETVNKAYQKAFECDPVSIFGGIVALNREVNEALALELNKIFLEIVIAPSFSEDALKVLYKKQNLRVIELKDVQAAPKVGTMDAKKVLGGILVQSLDNSVYDKNALVAVTKATPTAKQAADLEFAFKVVKHTKSNAIVVAKDGATLGLGNGQTNRIWATNHALEHSGEKAKGAVMASDAFFPFSDCVEAAAKAGISAIIQPGGSKNDADSIAQCDKNGISMVFCGQRHFKH